MAIRSHIDYDLSLCGIILEVKSPCTFAVLTNQGSVVIGKRKSLGPIPTHKSSSPMSPATPRDMVTNVGLALGPYCLKNLVSSGTCKSPIPHDSTLPEFGAVHYSSPTMTRLNKNIYNFVDIMISVKIFLIVLFCGRGRCVILGD